MTDASSVSPDAPPRLPEPAVPARPAAPAPAPAAGPDRRASGTAPRAAGLDGVRALAVLAVLAFHENLPWIPGGFLGVDVFFVLSGYLITDLLVSRLASHGVRSLGQFWVRRARRLLPALAAMLVTVTAAVAVLEPQQLAALRPALLGAVTYTSNWTQALAHQSYFSIFGPPPPLEHLWSLAVEEQFYLIWPLVVVLLVAAVRDARWRPLVPAAGALASAVIMMITYRGGDPSRVYFGTDTHASGLMIGAQLALTLPLARVAAAGAGLRRRLDVIGLAGLAVLGWACWHFSGANRLVYPGGLLLASLAAGGLVLAAAAPGLVGTVLGWRPLRWLGIRSYGIYLWHWPVIALTEAVAVRGATSWPARVADAVLAVALAAASWRWLEEPILRHGLAAMLKLRWGQLRQAVPAVRSSPAATLTLVAPAALLSVACTATYGILNAPAGPSLQAQIAAGSKISSQTQTGPAAAASQPGGQPLLPAQWPVRALLGIRLGKAPRPVPARPVVVPGLRVTAIGDSVLLAAARELQSALPGVYIDAKISRQMSAGVALVWRLRAEHRLRPVVLVALGTNGTVSPAQVSDLHAAIGQRWLLLVTTFVPRPWEHEVNATLWAAARRYPDVMLVNWKAAIERHMNLLWSDGVHPQPSGGVLYARIVKSAVLAALARHQAPPPRHRRHPVPGLPIGGRPA